MEPIVRTALIAGVMGAIAASAVGRERTRIDNLVIGGSFTAFAAYRDPRNSTTATVLLALGEGLLWGITDRMAPHVKELIWPGGKATA